MTQSLRERQEVHESATDYKLLWQVPVVIRITLKNHLKLTDKLEEPYCAKFAELMAQTMFYVIMNISDSVFGYYQNDEMTIILRNDLEKGQVPWHNNRLQPIISTAASLVTLGFHQNQDLFDLDLNGNGIFDVTVFTVPSLPEAVNHLILHQSYSMGTALDTAVYYELDQKFGQAHTDTLLKNASYEDKKNLLLREADKDFITDYPQEFIRGIAVYKEPTLVYFNDSTSTKNKWVINKELPNFVADKDFLLNILKNGSDIFRGRSLLPKN